MSIHIMPLGPADLPALCNIEEICFPDDSWPECLLESSLQGKGGIALGLYSSGELIGCAIGRFVADEAELHSIAVLPHARRLGHARKMLKAFLAECQTQAVRTLWLEVRASNHAAIEMYRRFSFRILGRRPAYYQDGEDALILSLCLSDLPENTWV